MKTVIVNIPDKKKNLFLDFFKKHHLKIHLVEKEEDEDLIAKWIKGGIDSGEVSEAQVLATLKKNGAKI
jgi:hypothetical protein